jgi:hypothetical protein
VGRSSYIFSLMTILLRPTGFHWLYAGPADLCAHSPVQLVVNSAPLVTPEAGDWTVSAAALFLLRTLTQAHNASSRVGDQLFPCCGFTMYDVDTPDVVVQSCLSGVDFAVERHGETVQLTQLDGTVHRVPFVDWRIAVCAFSDAVREFYDSEPPREPADDVDARGFRVFLGEWARRRSDAEALT